MKKMHDKKWGFWNVPFIKLDKQKSKYPQIPTVT